MICFVSIGNVFAQKLQKKDTLKAGFGGPNQVKLNTDQNY